jgi:hypothetical protein
MASESNTTIQIMDCLTQKPSKRPLFVPSRPYRFAGPTPVIKMVKQKTESRTLRQEAAPHYFTPLTDGQKPSTPPYGLPPSRTTLISETACLPNLFREQNVAARNSPIDMTIHQSLVSPVQLSNATWITSTPLGLQYTYWKVNFKFNMLSINGKGRSKLGIFLCHSPNHLSNVPLVLNTQTGNVLPQFHCIYDNEFYTCAHDAKFQSLWQSKAKLQHIRLDRVPCVTSTNMSPAATARSQLPPRAVPPSVLHLTQP